MHNAAVVTWIQTRKHVFVIDVAGLGYMFFKETNIFLRFHSYAALYHGDVVIGGLMDLGGSKRSLFFLGPKELKVVGLLSRLERPVHNNFIVS